MSTKLRRCPVLQGMMVSRTKIFTGFRPWTLPCGVQIVCRYLQRSTHKHINSQLISLEEVDLFEPIFIVLNNCTNTVPHNHLYFHSSFSHSKVGATSNSSPLIVSPGVNLSVPPWPRLLGSYLTHEKTLYQQLRTTFEQLGLGIPSCNQFIPWHKALVRTITIGGK